MTARKQGNHSRAARIIKDALREAEEYREINPGTVAAAHALAEHYIGQYRFVEAELLYRAVLEVREKVLGSLHNDVIDSLKKVAIVQIMAFRSEALGRHDAPTLSWAPDSMATAFYEPAVLCESRV